MSEPSKEAREVNDQLRDVLLNLPCNGEQFKTYHEKRIAIIQSALDAAVKPYRDSLRDAERYIQKVSGNGETDLRAKMLPLLGEKR